MAHEDALQGTHVIDGGHADVAQDPHRREIVREEPVQRIGDAQQDLIVEAPPALIALEHSRGADVEAEALSLDMVGALDRLQPFGQENPEPLWVSRGVAVEHKRTVGDTHLKLLLGEQRHEAIGFGLGALLHDLPERVDIAFRLERNSYAGRVGLQLRLEDLRPSA